MITMTAAAMMALSPITAYADRGSPFDGSGPGGPVRSAGFDFDGQAPADQGGGLLGRIADALGVDASPIFFSLRRDKGVDVYSELASPLAKDHETIPGVGRLGLGTQLREGEQVRKLGESADKQWAFISIPGQNYSGWVRAENLSGDGRLAEAFPVQRRPAEGEQSSPLRESFVAETATWEGTDYKWGGISKGSGVDCSGLVKGSFDNIGLGDGVPRVSADQKEAAKPVPSGGELAPGDLIFTVKRGEDRVSHVIVYIGGGEIREAMMSGTKVEKKSFQSRFGVPQEQLLNGGEAGKYTVYFGTFF